jgi:hypothetical protein
MRRAPAGALAYRRSTTALTVRAFGPWAQLQARLPGTWQDVRSGTVAPTGEQRSRALTRALLVAASRSLLNPETEEALQPTLSRATIEGIPLSGPCRFPIRIDLPTFADALERSKRTQESLTLLAHIADRLSREMDCAIDVDDIRAWLRLFGPAALA